MTYGSCGVQRTRGDEIVSPAHTQGPYDGLNMVAQCKLAAPTFLTTNAPGPDWMGSCVVVGKISPGRGRRSTFWRNRS